MSTCEEHLWNDGERQPDGTTVWTCLLCDETYTDTSAPVAQEDHDQ